MLPQALPHPPHIDIPKYIPNFHSHLTTRPRLSSASSCYEDISHLVSSSVSPVQSHSPATVDDDHIASPHSPPGASGNYHYVQRASAAFDSPISPTEMYDNDHQNTPYSASYQSSAVQNYNIHGATHLRESENQGRSYLPESPSPTDVHPASSFTQSMSAPHSQERFPQSIHPPYPPNSDRYCPSPEGAPGRYSRQGVLIDKYPTGNNSYSQNTTLDHRRMSEPAVLGSANLYAAASSDPTASRYQQINFAFNPLPASSTRSATSSYTPALQRGASVGSLRDLRQQHFEYPPNQSSQGWTPEGGTSRQPTETYSNVNVSSDPISPLQPNFSGGAVSSPAAGLQYSPIIEHSYGPSPPNTGTSTSSAPRALNINISRAHQHPQSGMPPTHIAASPPLGDSNGNKTYSFVALPGNSVRKRPRRRYDEIERLYQCSWPDCTKAYGTLNHLNAHVTMQKHGSKRSPNEFKELRKQWRKAKKESEVPSVGPIRRSSLNQRHDQDVYERYDSNSPQRPAGLNLSSVSIPHSGSGERYAVAVDEIRYPVDERDDPPEYSIGSRQRYGGVPASWHPNVAPSPRSGLHQLYTSTSLPLSHQSAHHSQLPQINVHSLQPNTQSQASPISPHHIPQNRLPADSTLLTPLPGYQPPSILAPLQITDLPYPSENYADVYDEESTGRPGTGHASIGYGSGEEYER